MLEIRSVPCELFFAWRGNPLPNHFWNHHANVFVLNSIGYISINLYVCVGYQYICYRCYYNAVGTGHPPLTQINGDCWANNVKLDSDADVAAAEAGNDVFLDGRLEEIEGMLPVLVAAPDVLAKSANNSVISPTRTSVTFPLENSTAVALTTSVIFPSRITVPLLASSPRSGGRNGELGSAH